MKRLLMCGMLVAFAVAAPTADAQDKKKIEELKKGLQALNDFVDREERRFQVGTS